MDDAEVGGGIRAEGMAVNLGGDTVGGPSGVGDGDLGDEDLVSVDAGRGDLLAKTGDFADLLEVSGLSGLVTVDTDTGRIVAAVLLTSKTTAEDLKDLTAGLK
jgi:hypothetical protein